MRKGRLQIGTAMIVSGMLLLTGSFRVEAALSADEGRKALENAQVVSMRGDLDDIVADTDIWADGQVAGHVQERGFLNSKDIVTTGKKEEWFYLRYVTDEPINDVEGEVSATTYGYYDMEDNCLGYAQERVVDNEVFPRDYYLVFLDAEGNPKDYLADENGSQVYDYEGNVIATAQYSFGGFLHPDKYDIEIKNEEDCGLQMEFQDKMGLYMRIDFYIQSTYGD